jgi:succinate dehydrogenase/fumarate reductase flavoprotein subunit
MTDGFVIGGGIAARCAAPIARTAGACVPLLDSD